MNRTRVSIDLELLRRLIDVDEDESLDVIVHTARMNNRLLPQLVLSVLEKAGVELGSGSRDELERARDRAACYQDVCDEVISATSARVVKGPSLAALYPEGLCRPVGDLDVVVENEEGLWAALQAISTVIGIDNLDVGVSLFGNAGEHMVAQAAWPARDPILDRFCSVDICTAGFAGDGEMIEPRRTLPADRLLTDLLSIAEERFQRAFGVRDVIDVYVLSGLTFPPIDQIVAAAQEYRLAPEISELLTYASAQVELGSLSKVIDYMEPAVSREMARRSSVSTSSSQAAAVQPLHGFLLRRASWRDAMPRSVVHHYSGGRLLLTPLGDYMLVAGPVVSQPEFEAAMEELNAARPGV